MKGTSSTVAKGMGLNLGMFATFDTVKEILNKEYPQNTTAVSLISSMLGGAAGTILSLPFDNANTKMQK